MENLPPEILLSIIDTSSSIPELLKYRNLSRTFRKLADKSCTKLAFDLGRAHIHAFDDALLATRLQRIPSENRCHYDFAKSKYSFHPSEHFFQAVMEGKDAPAGCPIVPAATWYEEIRAVVDLYLLGVAWISTKTMDGASDNSTQGVPGGLDFPLTDELHRPMLEAFVRNFYRVCIFTSTFGPRVFAEPLTSIIVRHADDFPADIGEQSWMEAVKRELEQYPVFQAETEGSMDGTSYALFQGFFEWLYAQPEPRDKLFWKQDDSDDEGNDEESDLKDYRYFRGQDRELLAFMQVCKIYDIMHDRNRALEPAGHDCHVMADFNPIYPSLCQVTTAYRPRLQHSQSAWNDIQSIINEWAESDNASLVLPPPGRGNMVAKGVMYVAMGDRGEDNPFSKILAQELKNRFGKRYDWVPRLDLVDKDFGVLDPRPELWDWDDPHSWV